MNAKPYSKSFNIRFTYSVVVRDVPNQPYETKDGEGTMEIAADCEADAITMLKVAIVPATLESVDDVTEVL